MTAIHDADISLVATLWRFIEEGGSPDKFSELRERVRLHGELYDAVPALLAALEGLLPHVPGAREPDITDRPCLERAVSVAASVRGLS